MSEKMHQSDDNKYIPMTSIRSGRGEEVGPDVFYYTNQIVNLVMLGTPGEPNWVLVDAGMPKSGEEIKELARTRFGDHKPYAIVLTHGHFDHVGGIVSLIEEWDVPVYAHPLEFPFLTGKQAYPEPDTTVEGGMLAKIASIYPHEPINIEPVLQPLPGDGSVPGLIGWRWIHVPGHSPGQVALFRDSDGVLISADAFVTVRQDSMYKVLLQEEEVNGPPRYLTTDWQEAWESVKKLEALQPQLVIPGHGRAMSGEPLTGGLRKLVVEFPILAMPDHGKYLEPDEPDYR